MISASGALLGGVLQEGRHAVEESKTLAVGVEWRRLFEIGQPLPQFWCDAGDVGRAGTHDGPQLGGRAAIEVAADDLHPGPVGRRPVALVAAPPEGADTLSARVAQKLFRHPRLADARFAGHQDDLALAADDPRQRMLAVSRAPRHVQRNLRRVRGNRRSIQ